MVYEKIDIIQTAIHVLVVCTLFYFVNVFEAPNPYRFLIVWTFTFNLVKKLYRLVI